MCGKVTFALPNPVNPNEMRICPYCSTPGEFYFRIFSRIYNRCIACDLIFKINIESYDKVLSSYRNGYFNKHSTDQLEGKRKRIFFHILNLIERKREVGRLLDVGTGCGFFIVAAKNRGWGVNGIEPSIQSIEVAKQINGLEVFNGTLREYCGNGLFDVVTFINVLDHSTEPWKEIERANHLLEPGGIIYIRFPNGFLHSRIYQFALTFGLANKLHKFLIFHQFSFTPRYIMRLLSDLGFTEITFLNSPLTEGDPNNLFLSQIFANYIKKILFLSARATRILSYGKILLGTSMEITAIKRGSSQS